MKQGWEIKKLGEVCEIQGGSTPKRTESLYWDGGTYPWFTIEDIREQGRIITDTKQKVTKVAWDKLRVFPKDTVLLCCTASIGEYAITHIPITSNQQFNGLMIKDKSYLSPMYLMHYCATLKEKLSSLSGKATIDFVSAEKVRQITIPVPPREEQERIVEELDCLSGVIEKKREQLRELDALAQSIFYQMFGDPITNEKGWEVKRLKDVCSDIIDGDHNPPPKSDNGIPFITISNINKDTKTIELANTYYVTEDYYNSIKPNKKPKKGDVLYTVTGSYGLPVLIKEDIRFCFQRHIGLLRPTDVINSVYLYIWAMLPQTKYQADDIATGIAQKTVSLSGLKQMSIILPPLTLQQEFANKIEAIEKQKALIKQSITQTETLFNSRMAYYFN